MTLLAKLFVQSAASMIVVLIIGLAGAFCAVFPKTPRPIFNTDTRRDMSFLTIYVTWPCLAITTVGAVMHTELLAESWVRINSHEV